MIHSTIKFLVTFQSAQKILIPACVNNGEDDQQCLNGGTCISNTCECLSGYYGNSCEHKG